MITKDTGGDATGGDGPVTEVDISGFANSTISFGGNLLRLYGLLVPILGIGILPFILWALLEDVLTFVPYDVFRLGSISLAILWIIYLIYALIRLVRWVSGAGAMGSEMEFSDEELARTLPHNGATLREVLAGVRQFAESNGTAVKVRETSRSGQVWFYRGLALLVFFAGITIPWFLGTLGVLGTTLEGALLGGGAGLGTFLAFFLFIRAGRAAQPDLDVLLEQDTRTPVLFLRSFKDDRILSFRRFKRWMPWQFNYAIRFEQAIADRFNDLGPLIAVGEPGQKLPQIGAARVNLSDDDWQDAVTGWVATSRLIVMIAGPTEWIRWELGQILEEDRLGQLFILIPPGASVTPANKATASAQDRWSNVRAGLQGTPWETALNSVDPDKTLLVLPNPDGGVTAITSSNHLMQDYRLAIAIAVYDVFCR